MDHNTGRDIVPAQTFAQISKMTLAGSGFTHWAQAGVSAMNLHFRLCRPYGHRRIEIVLEASDTYTVRVFRMGRKFVEREVCTVENVYCDQLDEMIIKGIDLSVA